MPNMEANQSSRQSSQPMGSTSEKFITIVLKPFFTFAQTKQLQQMYEQSKQQALTALPHSVISSASPTFRRQNNLRTFNDKQTEKKPGFQLNSPQIDLFDGLYNVASPKSDLRRLVSSGSGEISRQPSSNDSLSDKTVVKEPRAASGSPQLSCCSSDVSEFENLQLIEKQVFKSGRKEKVPEYLIQDHPPKEGEPCREYLLKQKKWGERPPAEAFMKIANQLYIEHMAKTQKQDAKKKQKSIFGRRHKSHQRRTLKTMEPISGPSSKGQIKSGQAQINDTKLFNFKNDEQNNMFSNDVSQTFKQDNLPIRCIEEEFESPSFAILTPKSVAIPKRSRNKQSTVSVQTFRQQRASQNDSAQSIAISTNRSTRLSKRTQRDLKVEKERLEDEERYKLIFGTANLQFKKKPSIVKDTSTVMSSRQGRKTVTKLPISSMIQISTMEGNSQMGSFRQTTSARKQSQESELGISENNSSVIIEKTASQSRQASTMRKKEGTIESTAERAQETSKVQQTSKASQGKQFGAPNKKILINTHEVFVKIDKCLFPDGYIQPKQRVGSRKTSHQEASAFQKRWKFDEKMKEFQGDDVQMPTQQDYFKLKIKEKEELLSKMIEEGKQKLTAKRIKEAAEKKEYNTFDKLVQRVERKQKQEKEMIINKKALFQENIDRHNRQKQQKREENAAQAKLIKATATVRPIVHQMQQQRGKTTFTAQGSRRIGSKFDNMSTLQRQRGLASQCYSSTQKSTRCDLASLFGVTQKDPRRTPREPWQQLSNRTSDMSNMRTTFNATALHQVPLNSFAEFQSQVSRTLPPSMLEEIPVDRLVDRQEQQKVTHERMAHQLYDQVIQFQNEGTVTQTLANFYERQRNSQFEKYSSGSKKYSSLTMLDASLYDTQGGVQRQKPVTAATKQRPLNIINN